MKDNIKIIFENQDFAVLSKPAGLPVHGDGKAKFETLVDFVLEKWPEIEGVGEDAFLSGVSVKRPGIVHRLDKDTSGIILIAKNQHSFEYFKNVFKIHQIDKVYEAFVYGWPKEDEDVINVDIGRSSSDIRKWTSGRGKRGTLRTAITYYRVLSRIDKRSKPVEQKDRIGGNTQEGTFAHLSLSPKTGRTHQLRVHLSYINHAIVSDSLYASKREKALGFDRLALHAKDLSFVGPDGKDYSFSAPYPEDFEKAIKSL
ncbi:RluA family pseudouridine synthase [Candidatus Nomurabacteria bacterium]|nr:RluA family pseudouridine synthase [Candidatus Nomurabacteria bacterium]USN94628.1 MAG: RluA family pseudouridine synthase [Candidatus Nomurabacteria bacterium]